MESLVTSIFYLIIIGILVVFFMYKQRSFISIAVLDKEYIRKDTHQMILDERNEAQEGLALSKTENAVLKAQLESETKNVEREKRRLDEIQTDLLTKFESLASKVAQTNSENFRRESTFHLDQVLKPLGQSIEKIEAQIKETNESRIRENSTLRAELQQLGKLNFELQQGASNLTNALTMNPKHQGAWGEQILETLLDRAGLVKNLHYEREVAGITDENRLRADVIIHLPENRHLVIDSKVSLNAYNRFCSTQDEEAKQHLRDHVKNIKSHIDKLASKRYEDLYQINSPDMIFMFLPIEGSLITGIQSDPELFHYAIERNVMVTTASTLFVSMKIVSDLWQRNKQFENAELIAEEAGKLRDQVIRFLDDMQSIGKGLENAKVAFDSASKRLNSGRNNMVRVAERIEELGAKVKPNDNGKVVMKKLAS